MLYSFCSHQLAQHICFCRFKLSLVSGFRGRKRSSICRYSQLEFKLLESLCAQRLFVPKILPTQYQNLMCQKNIQHVPVHGMSNKSTVYKRWMQPLCSSIIFGVHILTKFSANLRKFDYYAASMNCTQTQLHANTMVNIHSPKPKLWTACTSK